MGIVTTGQITIVDNNDARPLTAYITATPGTQQIYTKDESAIAYLPDWTSGAGLVLTARVFAGGPGAAVDVTGQLTNRKWSTDLSTALTGTAAAISTAATLNAIFVSTGNFTVLHNAGGSTLTIKANMMDSVSQGVLYFEGDYTDPTTGLVSKIIAQISLGMVKTGTNAVYILTRGTSAIEQATGTVKNVAVIATDLVRAAGVDTTGVTYKFYENNGATQITNAMATKYGMKTTSASVQPSGTPAEVGVGLPASGAWSTSNTLVIHETAVNDMGVYRVEAKDSDGTIYQGYFTIYDASDPYSLNVISSAGDKLQNGVGLTSLTPEVFYGSTKVASLTGWTFAWTFYNRDGKRGAFVDTTRTAVAGGRTITTHTTGAATAFTYSGAAITFSAGDIIKTVTPGGIESFYEVASATGNTVTIRAGSTNNWLNFTDFPAPVASQFTNGSLFVCRTGGGQATTTAGAALTVTGDEVDVKARIFVEANRP